MNPLHRAAVAVLLVAAAAGCGVRPTGVIDSGEPASGLRTGLRIYFASDTGLRGVSRLTKVDNLNFVIKLLLMGPTPSEQNSGLTNLVEPGSFSAVGHGNRVTLEMSGEPLTSEDQLSGQLVCSLARAQSVLDRKIRPDDVQVTLKFDDESQGPYRCSNFLNR